MDTLWIQINLRSFINQMDASSWFMTPFWFKCRFFCNVVGLWRRYKYTEDISTRERSSSLLFMNKDNSIFSIGGAALCPLYVLRLCVGWHGDTCSQDILLLAPARPPGPCQQPRHGKERWGHLLGQRGAASRYLV